MVFHKNIVLFVALVIAFLAGCTLSTPVDEQLVLPVTPDPQDPVFCTQDVQECPDGSYVGRDSDNNCEFFPCPEPHIPIVVPEPNPGDEVFCTQDIICCDGVAMGRDPATGCSCPEGMSLTPGTCGPANGEQQEMACTKDARACPDGSSVGRDGFNNCEFHPCPQQEKCDANTPCEDGFSCYKVSGKDRPYCYADGLDVCQFTDCSENQTCVVMESYPAQVACQ